VLSQVDLAVQRFTGDRLSLSVLGHYLQPGVADGEFVDTLAHDGAATLLALALLGGGVAGVALASGCLPLRAVATRRPERRRKQPRDEESGDGGGDGRDGGGDGRDGGYDHRHSGGSDGRDGDDHHRHLGGVPASLFVVLAAVRAALRSGAVRCGG
jgi:hypothetical protein